MEGPLSLSFQVHDVVWSPASAVSKLVMHLDGPSPVSAGYVYIQCPSNWINLHWQHTSIAFPHRCHPCSHWTCQTHVAVWNRCSQASWCCSWALRGSLGLQHVWLGSLYPMCYAFPYFQLNSGWLDAIFCHVNDPRMETKEKDGFSAWLQASDRCRDLYIVHLLGNLTPRPKLDSLCRTRLCRLRNGMQRIKVKRQKLMPAIKAVRDPFLFPVALRSLPESTGTCLFKCIGQLLCGLLPHFLNLAALNPAHPQRMARTSPMAYWIPFRFSDFRAFCYPLSVALPLESIHIT